MKKKNITLVSVSYTHLDVYKRQHPGSQDHCQCAKSSPSEVPGNGQPEETESNAGENG